LKPLKTLFELDAIVRTIYILNYIDSSELRRNVQKALNRGEAYHKLRRAVFYANFGKFRVRTELEQQIWSECSRLVANAIIFYNAFVLSELMTRLEKAGRYEDADLLKKFRRLPGAMSIFTASTDFIDLQICHMSKKPCSCLKMIDHGFQRSKS
jgi:hypothetical protein